MIKDQEVHNQYLKVSIEDAKKGTEILLSLFSDSHVEDLEHGVAFLMSYDSYNTLLEFCSKVLKHDTN